MTRKYLISAEHYEHARCRAADLRLHPGQWSFVPWDKGARAYRLAGISGMDEDHLIGRFTTEEKARLMRR